MEVFLALGLAGLVLMAPILAIVAIARASRLQRELGEATTRIAGLENKLESLAKRVVGARPMADAATRTSPSAFGPRGRGPCCRGPHPAAPVRRGACRAPHVPAAASAAARCGDRSLASPLPRRDLPPSPADGHPPPPPRPPPRRRPRPLPRPRSTGRASLGLKGAAWLGGITHRHREPASSPSGPYDQGTSRPRCAFAGAVLGGVIVALVWAERQPAPRLLHDGQRGLRRRHRHPLHRVLRGPRASTTCSPLSVTFALMALVTVVAGLLADPLRRALHRGARPAGRLRDAARCSPPASTVRSGLFSYVLLLEPRACSRWRAASAGPRSCGLGLAGTLVIELGWFSTLHVAGEDGDRPRGLPRPRPRLPARCRSMSKDGDDARLAWARRRLGGLVPFVFALVLAGSARLRRAVAAALRVRRASSTRRSPPSRSPPGAVVPAPGRERCATALMLADVGDPRASAASVLWGRRRRRASLTALLEPAAASRPDGWSAAAPRNAPRRSRARGSCGDAASASSRLVLGRQGPGRAALGVPVRCSWRSSRCSSSARATSRLPQVLAGRRAGPGGARAALVLPRRGERRRRCCAT